MEPGGKISIRVYADGAHAVVVVKDTGIGIPAAELPHIFEIFSQVRSHKHHAQGGLGLGLSVVKSLVNMHGGSVHAHSAGPGQGSTFVVQLPLAEIMGLEEPSRGPGADSRRRFRFPLRQARPFRGSRARAASVKKGDARGT